MKSVKPMVSASKRSGWVFLVAPRITLPTNNTAFRSYERLHMNMLNLDGKLVIVEQSEEPTIKSLKE